MSQVVASTLAITSGAEVSDFNLSEISGASCPLEQRRSEAFTYIKQTVA